MRKIIFTTLIFAAFLFMGCGELSNQKDYSVLHDSWDEDTAVIDFSSFVFNREVNEDSLSLCINEELSFLPQNSKIEVSFLYDTFAFPEEGEIAKTSGLSGALNISAHLLDAYPPDDSNPYVRGAYTSKESLQEMIEERSVDIYRKIFKKIKIPAGIIVNVECRHGVRVSYDSWGNSETSDESMVLFSTGISGENAAKVNDWAGITIKGIDSIWEVQTNIIPYLKIEFFY